MSYIEENVLTNSETLVSMIEKSKIKLFWSWFFGVLGFWLLLIPTIKAIIATLRFKNTEYAVTNKKVIEKTGIVSIVCDEMKLEKVENVTIIQTFFGRLFDYGTVCIQGTNRNNVNFYNVKSPALVKKQISVLIEGLEQKD